MDRRLPPLLVAVFINIAGFSLILPLLPFYGQVFAAGPFEIALLFAAYSFGNVFGEIYWGRQSDVWGRRKVLAVTTFFAALSYVAFAYAPTLWAAIGIRVVSGFFSGTLSVAQGFIADVSAPERRAKTMGYFGAAFSLGFVFGPAIGGIFAGEEIAAASFRLPIFIAGGFIARGRFLAGVIVPGIVVAGAGLALAAATVIFLGFASALRVALEWLVAQFDFAREGIAGLLAGIAESSQRVQGPWIAGEKMGLQNRLAHQFRLRARVGFQQRVKQAAAVLAMTVGGDASTHGQRGVSVIQRINAGQQETDRR